MSDGKRNCQEQFQRRRGWKPLVAVSQPSSTPSSGSITAMPLKKPGWSCSARVTYLWAKPPSRESFLAHQWLWWTINAPPTPASLACVGGQREQAEAAVLDQPASRALPVPRENVVQERGDGRYVSSAGVRLRGQQGLTSLR